MSYGMNGWNKPGGDLVSREAVIREIMTDVRTDKTACLLHVNLICNRLERLPSAQPDVTDKNVGDMMSRLDTAISNAAYILDALMAYRNIVDSGDCNRCGKKKTCEYVPNPGQLVRYNCPFYEQEGEG